MSSLQIQALLDIIRRHQTPEDVSSDDSVIKIVYDVVKSMEGIPEVTIAMNKYLDTSKSQGKYIYQHKV